LKGQQVEFVISDINSPSRLLGLFADAITVSFEYSADNLNVLEDTPS